MILVMGTMYSDVQHYFRILQFCYGGEGEMMIFLLHCYSTAAMPYMGAQGGGGGLELSFLKHFSGRP